MIQKLESLEHGGRIDRTLRDAIRRGHLEDNVYRTIDAIINRQMEMKQRMPKHLGNRRYLHSFSPQATTIIDGYEAEVTFISRLDFEEVKTSDTGRKTVTTFNHYTILTSDGQEVHLPALSDEALDLLESSLDQYYRNLKGL